MGTITDPGTDSVETDNVQINTQSEVTTDTTTEGATDESAPWYSTLPEDLRDNPSITKYKTPEDLARGKLNADKVIGYDRIPVPTEKSGPEVWDEVYARLGRPENPDGYTFKGIEGKPIDENLVKSFSPIAHKAGINQQQLSVIEEWWNEAQTQAEQNYIESANKILKQQETTLRKEWGNNYEAQKQLAYDAIRKFGGEDAEYFVQTGLADEPMFVRLMNKVGKMTLEDSIGTEGAAEFESATDIRKEIDEIRKNREHPFNIAKHPDHQQEVRLMSERYQKMQKLNS